ncbi:MAG TPA: cation:proton antiporter [Bryobacteraceae bacterium]|nr:cation:proton antiporter [Bryobacteraceae bacterium]
MGIASDFVLIVLAGLLGGLLARALRVPLLVGYVAAGVLVGPYTAGPTVVQVHEIERLADIGVALLLFSLGLEMSFQDLQPVRRMALIGGPLQILLTSLAAAAAGRTALGMPVTEAIWFGAMISLSSTVVVLKTLSAAGVTSTLASRVMIGLLVVQDLAVVPMLIILPQLGDPGHLPLRLARAIGIAAVFLAAVVVLGVRLLPPLLRRVLRLGSRELFLVSVVAIGVGVGYATERMGLSFALGAFVAGLILSESEFSRQALSDVVPLRDIFGLLFFVTVGMLLDPRYALAHAARIALIVPLIFLGKSLIAGGLARAFGYVNMAPWIVGLGLSQVGEFSFLLARTGVASGALSKPAYDLALTCTILTMALSPAVSGLALPLGRAWRSWRKPAAAPAPVALPPEALHGHIVVAGYGRSGQAVARVLRAAGIPLVVVELNHAVFGALHEHGLAGVWGDITSEEIQHAARIESARMLVLAVPDLSTAELGVDRARRLNPAIVTIARAARPQQMTALRKLGVDAVVQAEFEGGVELVRQALIRYPADGALAARLLAGVREEFYGGYLKTPSETSS